MGTAARQAAGPNGAEWTPPIGAAFEGWSSNGSFASARARDVRAQGGLARQAMYVAIDVALVCSGGLLVYGLRFGFANLFGVMSFSSRALSPRLLSSGYPAFLVLYNGLIVLSCIGQDLYRTARERSALDESFRVTKAVLLATAVLVLFIFTSGNKEISRMVVACAGALNAGTLSGWRYAKRRYVLSRAERGVGVSRVLIVGAGKIGKSLAAWLGENPHLGFSVCGFLDEHRNGDKRVLGTIGDLRKVALAQFVDQLFVTLPGEREMVKELCLEARRLRLNLNVVPDLYDGLGWRAPLRSIGGFPIIELLGQPIPVLGLAVKRAIDVGGAALGLLVAAPVLAVAALWVRFDSKGPILYSALRVGKKGRRFRCYKLRTMIAEADRHKEKLRKTNEREGPFFKMENDPRVTRSGRWLRKYSIDELPQLLNVLRGDMSLVGPRPHPIDDFERYSLEHLRRLDVKPGVTGLWQITARHDPSFDTNMKLDLEYIEDWNLRQDMEILWRTIPAVFSGEGH